MVKLSILIPTVESRRSLLSRLLWGIERQLTPEVEVLIYDGWIPFGDKVTEMFKLAKGKYAFVCDDDDMLASDHISSVLEAMESDPDYIAYKVLHLDNGKYAGSVGSSVHGDRNWQYSPYGIHHKCPIRTSIGAQVTMKNDYRCDRDWSADVHALITRHEVQIDKHLYIYDYWTTGTVGTEPTGKNANTQRDVGEYPYTPELFTWI